MRHDFGVLFLTFVLFSSICLIETTQSILKFNKQVLSIPITMANDPLNETVLSSEQSTQQQQAQIEMLQTPLEDRVYKVWCSEFPAKNLLLRNKNPLLYLYTVFISNIISVVLVLFITLPLGYTQILNSSVQFFINLIPQAVIFTYSFGAVTCFLQQPGYNNDNNTKNNFRLNLIKQVIGQWPFTFLVAFFLVCLLVYSLVVKFYEESLCFGVICELYFVVICVSVFFLSFTWVLCLQANPMPSNEKFYQIKFFTQRIFLGFIVTNVILDIYSDFMLFVQILPIDKNTNLAIYYWVFALAIFGMIDFVLLVLSVRFRMYTLIVFNKIVLFVITVLVLIYFALVLSFVGQFCLVTTAISFAYYYWCYYQQIDCREFGCMCRCCFRKRNVDQTVSQDTHV